MLNIELIVCCNQNYKVSIYYAKNGKLCTVKMKVFQNAFLGVTSAILVEHLWNV